MRGKDLKVWACDRARKEVTRLLQRWKLSLWLENNGMKKAKKSGHNYFDFEKIVKLQLNIDKHRPLGGSQYVDLPGWVKAKKAVVNVKNSDEECFKWAILSALHHDEVDQKSSARVTQYHQWKEELKLAGLTFPVSLKDISKFERTNPTLAINVYGIDKKEIYPLRILDAAKNGRGTLTCYG
ncbi:Hypothetical predicted protein [Mytilus galloprovincialis]|uniref:Uncharacterized protein n=1 Tax=Mytilus galloprovincialis TaxID=29158 RepID=A0A8B6BKK2_MYTGA|nr:Hypothetical predicted protein [Mytilus galloprovincialis]